MVGEACAVDEGGDRHFSMKKFKETTGLCNSKESLEDVCDPVIRDFINFKVIPTAAKVHSREEVNVTMMHRLGSTIAIATSQTVGFC